MGLRTLRRLRQAQWQSPEGILADPNAHLRALVCHAASTSPFYGARFAAAGMLYGHAHSIYILCENLQNRGLKLNPQGIVATSMMLTEPERRVIENVCGRLVPNHFG